MYVCVCNRITDHEIRRAAEDGCHSMRQLGQGARCGTAVWPLHVQWRAIS
jgi:BFD-like [2Fe-2S] binding domain.